MSDLYLDLEWLPRPPADFRDRLRSAAVGEDPGRALIALGRHALDANQLDRLARTLGTLERDGRQLAPLTPFTLGLAASGTVDLVAPAVIASGVRHGLKLTCVSAGYGQAVQAVMEPASPLYRSPCDAILIALDHRTLPIRERLGDRDGAVEASLALVETMRGAARARSGAPCIVQTIASPSETLFGSFDRVVANSLGSIVDAINRGLAEQIAGSGDVLLDVDMLAATVGLAHWHSPREWAMAKLPFASRCLPLYADHVARLVAAMRGKARRCLVLDLDNTLWGGVIGDDGLAGIRLGQGDPIGEAFVAVQRLALALHERGVVLAVSSKNDDAVARSVFRDHPDMLLSEEHIAVFQANWTDKATNIAAIADTLSLGLSSLVLLDDNPVERALVRTILPEVAVPELPDDPVLFARTLAAAGYFEATAFSQEDRQRNTFYRDNARRAELRGQAGDVDAYLASLDMEIGFAPFDAVNRDRIVQLIGKSNQFNLTTRRYSARDIAALEVPFAGMTLQVRLKDMFGDNGIISVLIARAIDPEQWEIDTWLMSCRVLGRGVERMVLAELSERARAAGVRWLIGRYRPTDRNGLVRGHYESLGFEPIAADADGEMLWRRATDVPVTTPPMRIVRG